MRTQILAVISTLAVASNATPLGDRFHQRLHQRQTLAPSYAPTSTATVYGTPTTPAVADPTAAAPSAAPYAPSGGDTFQISISNQCDSDLSFGIFSVSSSFAMNSVGGAVNIPAGGSGSIAAPFTGVGMRLSASASAGADAQWAAQTLFEFGYSEYAGQTGTAYDVSVMAGSTQGLSVYPSNPQCPSKSCPDPNNCAPDQGWSDPGQVSSGSPADTVCYQGKTDFRVVWCG